MAQCLFSVELLLPSYKVFEVFYFVSDPITAGQTTGRPAHFLSNQWLWNECRERV